MSGYAKVLQDTSRTARKVHRCDECKREISIGEPYRYEFYVYGSINDSHRTCRHCLSMRNFILDEINDTFIYGSLIEEIWNGPMEHWKDRLFDAGFRRKWKRKDGKMWKVIK